MERLAHVAQFARGVVTSLPRANDSCDARVTLTRAVSGLYAGSNQAVVTSRQLDSAPSTRPSCRAARQCYDLEAASKVIALE